MSRENIALREELIRGHRHLDYSAKRHVLQVLTPTPEDEKLSEIVDALAAQSRFPNRTKAEDAYACLLTGLGLILEGYHADAIPQLQEAIGHYRLFTASRVALSYALLLNDRIEEALTAYRESIQLEPDAQELYLPLLQAFERTGQLERVAAAFADGLDLKRPFALIAVNPVVEYLATQPTDAKKNACLQILRALIQVEWYGVIRPRSRPEVPDLISVWGFLSASPSELVLQVDGYYSGLLESGMSNWTIKRRAHVVRGFLEFCCSHGYIDVSEAHMLEMWRS